MRKYILFYVMILLMGIFTACSSSISKNKIDISESESCNSSSQKLNSSSEQGSSKIMKEKYEDLSLTMKVDSESDTVSLGALQAIYGRVKGISMIRPKGFQFENIKEVPFEKLNWYFRSAAYEYPFYEKILEENVRLQAGPLYLNYEQVMMIIKNEFEVEDFPFSVANKENLKVDISPGPEANCKFIKTIIKGESVVVQSDVNDMINDDDPSHFVKMEYTFKLREDDTIIPISGRRI
ncbi:hypothetical protein RBG61_03390 [Paludicola sp. MB14-C6]|uniref:hypothetical protein n=1 Tax=Paludihabitans sp. MB14-C6 TaxID=3070656 RepID=UPI0027DC8A9E|nr:hypothetical protein [Paludicola sp. MB14-C6]WMJ23718.1 hypothetical protein RBG61_03390 [Paludicola sp. MB14-C6]